LSKLFLRDIKIFLLNKGDSFMKTPCIYPFVIALMLIIAAGFLAAQDFKGGVVKYQQTTKYNWNSIFNPEGKAEARTTDWLASLPKEDEQAKVLYFTEENALYEEDSIEKQASEPNLQRALMGASMRKPPTPELKKVFYDFGKNEKTEQVEFMTRNFLISDPIKNKAWKLTNRMIKVQNFICLGAELKDGDQTITAWFTSEIPISAGPDEFFGLPGLILVIEINGETTFIATSIDLTPPKKGVLSKPDSGTKVTQEEFNKIIEDKIKEFKETGGNKGNRRR